MLLVLVLLKMLPVTMSAPMMIDMSISSGGVMLFMMVPPMIGAGADDVGDDRGDRHMWIMPLTMIAGFIYGLLGPAVVQASRHLV
ncbi:hypothetical protein [Bradyrhizobium yuanmingense]|uniref:hypothetical protein n=1 Tax=Bradyrhizobium yuanmingense TaxID=108015 RepID=UPI0023B91B74|nr:hypothetical protein [Bradyrhizobium yuanmingense]MDF0584753.1 hypothetical protein [Bradyrhizobium yuanmingense]